MTPADERLVRRIRPMLARRRELSEKKMFGGICFMLNGNMCVGTWQGSLVVRLDKKHHDATLSEPHTRAFDITGRVMRGWALIDPEGINTEVALKSWLNRAANYARSLPPK